MSVDLGQVVGRGIKSLSASNNIVTVTYTDNTTSTFRVSGDSVVDTVSSGENSAVSSNAVYNALSNREEISQTFVAYGEYGFYFTKYGRIVVCDFAFTYTPTGARVYTDIITIPTGFTPSSTIYEGRRFTPRLNTVFPASAEFDPVMVYFHKENNVWKFVAYNLIKKDNTVRGQLVWFTD